MGNSQYERDFNDQSALKRPGRLDFRTLNNVTDAGDGYPGVQKCLRNYLHEGGMEKDLDINSYDIKNIVNITMAGDINITGELVFPSATIHSSGTEIHIHPNTGNADGNIILHPIGSNTASVIFVRNSVTENYGDFQFKIDGTTASLEGGTGGVGSAPTTLNINDADWDTINIGDASCSVVISGVTINNGIVDGVDVSAHVHTGADGSLKVDHVNLNSIGSNTHAQIDAHITSTATPHVSSGEKTTWNKINSLKQFISAHLWVDGGELTGDGIVLNTIGEKVAFSCKIPSSINETVDGFISITYSSPDADSLIDANLELGVNNWNGSQAVSFTNIENGTSFAFPNSIAGRFRQKGYLIANANITEDFTFLGKIELNESSRSITIYGIQFEFRAV